MALIIVLTIFVQKEQIETYITRIEFTKFQSISDAVAELKKNDLQEVFRELLIIGALLDLPINNPSYMSSAYITDAKADQMISSSECYNT